MDSRGTERLSLAAQSDGDRRVATSILLTMATALVLGTSAAVLMILSGPEVTALSLALITAVLVSFGFVGVQMAQVRMLETPGRGAPVVLLDLFLAISVGGLIAVGAVVPAMLTVAAFTIQSIARAISRSISMVESWEIEVDDSRVRFRRLRFSVPRGPWRSVGLEDAHARVLESGRDWFLEIGGIQLPVGPADEQARMLAERIEEAAARFRTFADDERAEDRERVQALAKSAVDEAKPRTLVPWVVESRAALFLVPWFVGLAALVGALPTGLAFGTVVMLRSGVWLWARRLRPT